MDTELPDDPAVPLLGVYLKEGNAGIPTATCTPMFAAALFTTAQRWKQPTCPSLDEWINIVILTFLL